MNTTEPNVLFYYIRLLRAYVSWINFPEILNRTIIVKLLKYLILLNFKNFVIL